MFGRKNRHAGDVLLSTPPTADLELLGGEDESSPVSARQVGSNHLDFKRRFDEPGSDLDDFFDGDDARHPDDQIARDLR